ncbi:hypothetical protein [Rhizobium indicum]|uniref:Uncharacterized protein n=1 Tax=Rhizobium indicum TaxID=2583231 RepID=A0ABX6P9A1_9HYPH|nr:hypothetical protein [Rhizobium indicum]QKK15623.1 hypothetical protein FFM53_004125 [Rhizobium indicum]
MSTLKRFDNLNNLEHKANKRGAHMSTKFIVVSFGMIAAAVAPQRTIPASTDTGALRIAAAIAPRWAGVAAYAVEVNDDTGLAAAPRLLKSFGKTAELNPA